jgi:hypothetical protein
MDKQRLIENIKREDVWDTAKHSYAETLIKKYDSEDVRDFLFERFKKTGDYYYISLLKQST